MFKVVLKTLTVKSYKRGFLVILLFLERKFFVCMVLKASDVWICNCEFDIAFFACNLELLFFHVDHNFALLSGLLDKKIFDKSRLVARQLHFQYHFNAKGNKNRYFVLTPFSMHANSS